jgi:hypothetical protein
MALYAIYPTETASVIKQLQELARGQDEQETAFAPAVKSRVNQASAI